MKTNSRKYFLCFKNRNEISDEKLIVNDDFHPQVGMYQCQLITYGKTNE
jgi:hypothetical protein